MAVGKEKPLRKNYKTWKTIRPKSIINCHQDEKQLDQNGYSKSDRLVVRFKVRLVV